MSGWGTEWRVIGASLSQAAVGCPFGLEYADGSLLAVLSLPGLAGLLPHCPRQTSQIESPQHPLPPPAPPLLCPAGSCSAPAGCSVPARVMPGPRQILESTDRLRTALFDNIHVMSKYTLHHHLHLVPFK